MHGHAIITATCVKKKSGGLQQHGPALQLQLIQEEQNVPGRIVEGHSNMDIPDRYSSFNHSDTKCTRGRTVKDCSNMDMPHQHISAFSCLPDTVRAGPPCVHVNALCILKHCMNSNVGMLIQGCNMCVEMQCKY